jgi:hypothetical protein
MKHFESWIEDRFTDRLLKNLTAGDDDSPDLFTWRSSRWIAIIEIEPRHPVREIIDNLRVMRSTLTENPLQFITMVGMESILVTVLTSTMAENGSDIVDRFHTFLLKGPVALF